MDIKLSEEQAQLQDMASKYMDQNCGFDFVRDSVRLEKSGNGRTASRLGQIGACPQEFVEPAHGR